MWNRPCGRIRELAMTAQELAPSNSPFSNRTLPSPELLVPCGEPRPRLRGSVGRCDPALGQKPAEVRVRRDSPSGIPTCTFRHFFFLFLHCKSLACQCRALWQLQYQPKACRLQTHTWLKLPSLESSVLQGPLFYVYRGLTRSNPRLPSLSKRPTTPTGDPRARSPLRGDIPMAGRQTSLQLPRHRWKSSMRRIEAQVNSSIVIRYLG